MLLPCLDVWEGVMRLIWTLSRELVIGVSRGASVFIGASAVSLPLLWHHFFLVSNWHQGVYFSPSTFLTSKMAEQTYWFVCGEVIGGFLDFFLTDPDIQKYPHSALFGHSSLKPVHIPSHVLVRVIALPQLMGAPLCLLACIFWSSYLDKEQQFIYQREREREENINHLKVLFL